MGDYVHAVIYAWTHTTNSNDETFLHDLLEILKNF